VTLTLRNLQTGQTLSGTASGEGVFRIFPVPPGHYELRVTAPDYGPFLIGDLFFQPNEVVTLEISLVTSAAIEARSRLPRQPELGPALSPLGNESFGTYREFRHRLDSDPAYVFNPAPEVLPPIADVFNKVPDRWALQQPEYRRYDAKGEYLYTKPRWYDPFNRNKLKGDYPIFGQRWFLNMTGRSQTGIDLRRLPIPSGLDAANAGSSGFFGRGEQAFASETLRVSLDLFRGDTSFRPVDLRFRFTPEVSLNFLQARERGIVNIDPRKGTDRFDAQLGIQEAFVEAKIRDLSPNYDFLSVRAGIQPFVSDFRGFIFSDNNLGFRVFGAGDNNRIQFNAVYFSMLEKDTNSGLNRFDTRHQNVYVANVFRQDFIHKGYTIQASVLYNDDRRSIHYDRNGFLVRPALIGDVRQHAIKVGYIGINGDGHLGKLNLTHSYYYAFGRDDRNPIAGRSVKVRSNMAAVEASMDRDYLRFKTSFFFAQGDSNPTDGKATGFDAILDDPNFVGGQFSFWNRNGIRLTQTGVGLVQGNSLLPSLRSSKTEGQANFINPGIFIYNAGVDAEVTQRLKAIFNVNYLRFHRTEPLEYVLFQNRIRHEIGWDYSLGIAYRPFLINNVTLTFGANTLVTGRGFRDIFTNRSRNCPPNVGDFCEPDVINPSKPLYSLFAQLKLVF